MFTLWMNVFCLVTCDVGCNYSYLVPDRRITVTYDHRLKKIGHPVRSARHKLEIGGLVVGWVTTSEYPLLYVFVIFFQCNIPM
jgi:hypothetical protein